MEKQAIEQIQKSAHIPELLKQISGLDGTKKNMPVAALPEGFKLHNLEQFMESRSSYRARMSTDSIDDFVLYLKGFEKTGSQCFIDAESMKAHAVLDLGTLEEPGHQNHNAHLALKKTAAYEALLQMNGRKTTQKELAEWLEDWKDLITCYDASGNAMSSIKAAAGIRRMTIESVRNLDSEVQDMSANMSISEQIEARSKDVLPAGFQFSCTPYSGLDERNFDMRLSVLTSAEKPTLVARIKQHEQVVENMAGEFKERLVGDLFGGKTETFIGSLAEGGRY